MNPRHRPGRSGRWRHSLRHSLRLRLIIVFVLLALAMSAVFVGGMERAFSSGWRDAARPLVADYVDRLAAEIGTPPDVGRAQALAERLPISIHIEGPLVNWDSNPGQPHRNLGPRASEKLPGPKLIRWPSAVLRLSQSLARGPTSSGWQTLALLLLLILIAYAYLRRLLRPLVDIRAGAERFGSGAFDRPIPVRRRDELGDLARRINKMASEIQGMLDAKRALLLALSHELRSPLTRARLNAELLPATAEGAAERDALLRDLAEMRDLISDLLESERLASPHAALHREPVDLGALVREVADEHAQGRALVLDIAPGLPPLGVDRTRVRLLVRNLVDNALRHGAEASEPPRVSLHGIGGAGAGGQGVELEVRDFGPGVDSAQLEHLTEPFYRTDGARQRATGGVGLGMYLCRLVAEAHGGSLEVRNAQPGLAVTARLMAEGARAPAK